MNTDKNLGEAGEEFEQEKTERTKSRRLVLFVEICVYLWFTFSFALGFGLIGVHSWFKNIFLEKRSQTMPVIIGFL
jgi:hypothetical protein